MAPERQTTSGSIDVILRPVTCVRPITAAGGLSMVRPYLGCWPPAKFRCVCVYTGELYPHSVFREVTASHREAVFRMWSGSEPAVSPRKRTSSDLQIYTRIP